MRYPLDELIDKRSIVQLKIERIKEDSSRLKKEYQNYSRAIGEYILEKICTGEQVEDWSKRLYEANGKTWDLEAKIRAGQIGNISLEKVGKNCIKIRESNGVRVRIKSEIVEKTGIGYKDIKINHASE